MSDAINMDLQSSMLLETLRQTPSIQDNNHQDSGGGGSAGDGNAKSTSSSSLSSSADGGGGVVGINSDGTSEKNALEAMDPAIMSTSAPSGSDSPVSGSGSSEKSNRTRYSVNQLLALRNLELSKKKPAFMVEPRSEKLARMFINLDRGTVRYGKSVSSMGKTSEAPYEDENGGGNGSSGNYGRNRVANGSNGGNTDGSSSGGGGRMDMRRSGGMDLRDPKDRLRKEDGIVLSPQRRSFNMGCQMPAAPGANASGLNIGGGLLRNERDLLGGRERRIGSGRILSRDVSWDYRPDKDAPESNDFRASGNANYRERERDTRDSRDTRDTRDARETRDTRDARDTRDTRDARDTRENRDTRDTRDPRDSRDRNDRDKDFRKDYDRDRDREERFERRPLNRDYDRNDKDTRNSRMSSRYSNAYNSNNDSHGGNNYHSNNYNHYHSSHHDRRRLYSDHGRDEEPEWFSEPTSQTDTIELRGFDDPVSEEETKSDKDDSRDDSKHDLLDAKQAEEVKPPSSSLQNDKNNNADASDVLMLGRSGASNDKTNANQLLTPTSPNKAQINRTPGDGASESSAKSALTATLGISNTLGPSKITDDDFNFEDFLKLDALPSSLLYPDLPASKDTGSTGGSRFSQWFKPDNTSQPQPSQQSGLNQQQQQPKQPAASHFADSRRSSLQDEINNMINDFTSTGLDDQMSDSNSNKYFAPISPAASTSSNSLLELFQRGDKQQQQQQQQQQPSQHRDRDHHPQQQLQAQQQPGHPHGHPLLGHPSNHPALHHQQQQQHHQQIQNRNLQQLLGVSGSGNIGNHGPHGPIPPAPSGGQIHSVEELEARFRQSDSDGNTRTAGTGPSIPRLITPSSASGGGSAAGGAGAGHLSNDAQQQEMNAFKKLLAQISENQPHNAQPTPAAHPPHHQSHPINILHHQQQQNELLQKMLHLNQMHHPVNDGRQTEILKRPEAQALLHGVARGEVTQHNLWQQLTNPATAQPHREILTSVLSTINTSPRVVSPNILIQPSPGGVPILPPATVPPAAAAVAAAAAANSANLLFQHHSKQQMRLSPLPNGMPQRIPSPRELQYHTQSIMQNALIRKKLEEQRENYRKRQEQQQQQQQNRQPEASSAPSSTTSSTTTSATTTGASSLAPSAINQQIGNQLTNSTANSAPTTVAASPAVATPVMTSTIASPAKQTPPSHSHSQHTSSPTPLAFTPTSVLRKMTAEKEIEPLSSNNSSINTPSSSALPNAQPNDRPPLGAGGHNQSLLMGLNNPLTQQQQQQQRNLAALIGAHPPLQPPHSQPPGPPPQLPHHHLAAGHHPSPMGAPQPAQPPQPNSQQMRGGHQPPGMPGGNIPWNLKQPHPGPQMPPMSKPQGRPILKGGNTQPQPPQQQPHPSPMSQMSFASNLEFQQQMQQFQGRSGNPILGAHQSQQQQQQQLLQQQQPHNQHQTQMNPHLQQLLQQRQQQQQRAIRNQHMQQIPPSFRMGPQQPQQPQSQGQHSHQGPQQTPGASGIINYNRDGGLSPTSNQLARWFSPELLAQASAGKLPSLNVGQAMSLEEFERNMQHSSATVHN
ncbi:homeobox protein cut-like isoform X2 [Ochlerotatus camptorhynchus]|uniref:homeobox protein cut-like isoform X2 n=1 Tax=Ochlerotatus camptorhynchus TaxID=644619 RepID=UPI0031DE7EF6